MPPVMHLANLDMMCEAGRKMILKETVVSTGVVVPMTEVEKDITCPECLVQLAAKKKANVPG